LPTLPIIWLPTLSFTNNKIMQIIICPGIHAFHLTDNFLTNLPLNNYPYLVFPDHEKYAFSSEKLLTFIQKYAKNKEVLLLAFSAGVVGAIATAKKLEKSQQIKGLIALDGWGVPLMSNVPLYRLSHDYFTYWSSNLLGAGEQNFYADPPVSHLDLWQFPHLAQGWQVIAPGCQVKCSAADFIEQILRNINYVTKI
jgi:hypothetical protein